MVDTREKVFFIKRLEDIGWVDPFPDDPMTVNYKTPSEIPGGDGPGPSIPESSDQFAYAKSRLIKGKFPQIIYIPTKEVLFKMMRACIGVAKKEDLWIHKMHEATIE